MDVIFGTLATLLACLVTYKLRNIRFKGLAVAASLPPVVFNAVIIGIEIAVMFPDPASSAPLWLACITNGISVGIGELISCTVLGVAGALAVWAAGLADIEGALALLIIGVVFGVVYGAYAMFWMAETLPRYYDENRICNFAQGAFHIHIPGVYYNNRNWKHILRAFRVWSMASLVLVPPCTAGAVLLERATGWQVWVAVLVVYIASLFGAIVIPAKRFE